MDIQNQVTKTNFSPIFQTFERKENNNVNLNTPNDSVNLYDMSYDMQLTKTYLHGGHIFNGSINGKNAEIKLVYITDENIELENNIGNKKIVLSGKENGKKNTGTCNEKTFDIDVEFYDRKKLVVKKMTGNINGEPIEIDFSKRPDIPKDSDTRDIINTILFTNGNMPFTINGKIVKLVMDENYKEIVKYKEEQKQAKLDKYILPSITAIGGAFLGICSNLITNTIEKGEGKKALKTVNFKKIFNKENIKNLFKKINLKEIEKLIKKLPKVKIK